LFTFESHVRQKKFKSDAKPNEANFRFDFKARILCGTKYFRALCDYHSKVLRFLKKVGLEVYVSAQLTKLSFSGTFPRKLKIGKKKATFIQK